MSVLVLDLGSGSCRATLVDRDGRRPGFARRDRSYAPVAGVPGAFSFDPDSTFDDLMAVTREALQIADIRGEDVVAVTASSIREGFVLYDDAGRELWACPNIDTRAIADGDELVTEGLADELYRVGGDWTSVTAPAKLRWLQRQEPDVWRVAHRLAMLADWLIHRLGGRLATDPSVGSSSGLFDLRAREWSTDLADRLGAAHLLPPIEEAGSVAGEISPAVAAACGLRAGTPVIRGGADTQLALLPPTMLEPGAAPFAVCAGTFWQTAAVTPRPSLDPAARLRTVCHVVPDAWVTEGIGFLHGTAIRWLRDVLGPSLGGAVSLEALDEAAADVPPGAHGVRFVGSVLQDVRRLRHPPVTLLGFDPGDPRGGGAATILRAIREEACFVAHGHLQLLEEVTGRSGGSVHLVGGASASLLTARMLASVLGRDVVTYGWSEATTTGAAMLAWSAVGGGRLEDWVHLAGERRVIAPVEEWVAPYHAARKQAAALRTALLGLADDGVVPYRFAGSLAP